MPLAYAETSEDLENEPIFTQQELDQMLAPIALYPDALLSQILMAATYPAEVAEAARWSREHPDLKGEDAVDAAEDKDWDPSVISLTAFPQILAVMDARPEWVEQLGDAFLIQQTQVMDTVQNLRRQALAAGNLQTNDQVVVVQEGQTIVIEQAAPQVVYVPYYNPTVVYGPWWWDAYPPVYWDPWPGYYSGFRSGYYYWGRGIPVGLGFFYSNFDWHRHHINVHRHHHRYLKHDRDRQRWAGSNTVRSQPQRSLPVAGKQEPIRPRSIPESVRKQDQLQNTYIPGTGSISERAEAFKRRDNRLVRPDIAPQTGAIAPSNQKPVTVPRQSTSQPQPIRRLESPEALSRHDNRLVRPDIPQTRAVTPTRQNPVTVPRQPLSQPQPMRRLEPPSAAMGSRGLDRQQQAIPNNRGMRLPQQSMPANRPGPSAQPRNFGPSQPRLGGNPLKGNGQSGGGGHYRR